MYSKFLPYCTNGQKRKAGHESNPRPPVLLNNYTPPASTLCNNALNILQRQTNSTNYFYSFYAVRLKIIGSKLLAKQKPLLQKVNTIPNVFYLAVVYLFLWSSYTFFGTPLLTKTDQVIVQVTLLFLQDYIQGHRRPSWYPTINFTNPQPYGLIHPLIITYNNAISFKFIIFTWYHYIKVSLVYVE